MRPNICVVPEVDYAALPPAVVQLSVRIVLMGGKWKLLSVNNAKPQSRLFPQSFSRLREDAAFIGG